MDELIYSTLSQLPTLILLAIIGISLFILSKGADILVDQAVSLSIRWGVSKMIIGATIVSLGTTLPEVTVSVMSSINGNSDLALGNAVGSIIANTALIIGISSLIGKLPVDKSIINRQGRLQLFSGILLAIVSLPIFSKEPEGRITQWMGFVFLGLLIFYMIENIRWGKEANDGNTSVSKEEQSPLFVQIIKLVLGVALVITSSKILIPSVEVSAIRVGIPQSVIAATLVAFGTSLPELITAVTSVRKGHGELAVGNIIGADILNILFVIGSSAAVTRGGLIVSWDFYKLQIPTMLIILFAFRIFAKNEDGFISKKEGAFLIVIYFIYLVLNYTWI